MFKKLKAYILNTFLPVYSKELLNELKEENTELKQQIRELKAYIDGMNAATNKRIKIINNITRGDK